MWPSKGIKSINKGSISSIFVAILLLHSTIAQSIDIQGDNPSAASQDNQDSPQDVSGQSREDEAGEQMSLPAPNELSVIRLNDTSVVLRWEFSDHAQENLQFFKIQHRPTHKKENNWKTELAEIPPSTRAYQINGLRPGNFQFIVSAVYDNDDNVPSTPPFKYKIRAKSKIKPEEWPEMKAPQIYWQTAESDYFRFKWKYEPKEQDHDIFGYLVYYRSAHTVSDFTIYNTMDSNVEIVDVEPDTPYEAKVVAYNTVGISEFSDTIRIRTEPQANSKVNGSVTQPPTLGIGQSTTLSIASTTTKKPTTTVSWQPDSREETSPTPTSPVDIQTYFTTTLAPKPTSTSGTPTQTTNSTSTTITVVKGIYQSITKAFNTVLGDQSDAMLIIRYLIIVLLPIILCFSVLICLRRNPSPSRKRNDSPSSTTTDNSMQFDLEINGYFKNSFPGVEKDYSPVSNYIDVHHGFVNNHTHLNFA